MRTFKIIFLVLVGLAIPIFFIVLFLTSRRNKRDRR
jgi:hypothetical protein